MYVVWGSYPPEDSKRAHAQHICKSSMNGILPLNTHFLVPKTHFDGVLTNRNVHVSELQTCNKTETDTRILTVRHMLGRWTATLLSWQYVFFRHSGYHNYGWALESWHFSSLTSLTSLRSWSIKVPHTDSVPHRDTTSQFLGYDKKTTWAVWTMELSRCNHHIRGSDV